MTEMRQEGEMLYIGKEPQLIVDLKTQENYIRTADRMIAYRTAVELSPDLLKGKRVVLVDEAVFTGTTLRLVCEKLRTEGVASIYICIPTSPCVRPCPALPQTDLLAQRLSPDEMRQHFQADGLWFLDADTFRSHTAQFGPVCTRCFL